MADMKYSSIQQPLWQLHRRPKGFLFGPKDYFRFDPKLRPSKKKHEVMELV